MGSREASEKGVAGRVTVNSEKLAKTSSGISAGFWTDSRRARKRGGLIGAAT